MKNRTFGKRTLAVLAAGALLLSLAASVFADAADPDSGVTVGQNGLTVTLSGTWTWYGNDCEADGTIDGDNKDGPKRDVGFAVDWDEGFTGNLVQKDAIVFHPGTATDNLVYQRGAALIYTCNNPGGANATGSWGPISHTYAVADEYTPCAIMYDVQGLEKVFPTTGGHSTQAGGTGHNTDNSIETNSFEGVSNCADVEIVVATPIPTAEGTVLANTGTPAQSVADSALSQNGTSPIPTIAFTMILLAALGTLAYANVKTVRNRS